MLATEVPVTIPLHPIQRQVADDAARFRVLAMGRRGGKTMLGVALCFKTALEGKRAWWVAPTYPIASVGWRALKHLARQFPFAEVRESERMLSIGNGWVQVKSADNPDALRGEGLDFVVLDEAAYISEDAWTEALRPALADRHGGAFIISTPNGLNWFYQVWQRGQDAQQPEWKSWRFKTSDNPYINPDEIAAARASLPEKTFLQEFEAEFLADSGAVFRGVQACATATRQEKAQDGHAYIFGCDWGEVEDFSVFAVVDVTDKALVHLDRSNHLDYVLQAQRLKALAERFHPALVVGENNSMGSAILALLRRPPYSLPVWSWTASNATKAAVIGELRLAFEQRTLRILNDPVLVGELQAYQSEKLPGGMVRYSAPDGQHDDTVMALAMAWEGARMPSLPRREPLPLGGREVNRGAQARRP